MVVVDSVSYSTSAGCFAGGGSAEMVSTASCEGRISRQGMSWVIGNKDVRASTALAVSLYRTSSLGRMQWQARLSADLVVVEGGTPIVTLNFAAGGVWRGLRSGLRARPSGAPIATRMLAAGTAVRAAVSEVSPGQRQRSVPNSSSRAM